MTIRASDGHGRVFMRDGDFHLIHWSEIEGLELAWKAGQTFYQVTGVYGEAITLKLAEVNGVGTYTKAALMAAQADATLAAEEEESRRKYEGG